MSETKEPYEEGKRAGLHPLIVVFAVLIGLWLFVFLIVPSSKNKQATGTEGPTGPVIEDPEAEPVLFKVYATVSDMNAIGRHAHSRHHAVNAGELLPFPSGEQSPVGDDLDLEVREILLV